MGKQKGTRSQKVSIFAATTAPTSPNLDCFLAIHWPATSVLLKVKKAETQNEEEEGGKCSFKH